MSGDRRAVRVYGALVRLYPRRFRDEYGPDLVGLFRDQCDAESVSRVCGRAVVDLVITIPTQHLEARMHRSSRAIVPILYLTIAVAGLALAVIGGTYPVTALLGVGVALGAGAAGVTAWRRTRPSPRALAGTWWKCLAGAAVLIAVVVVVSNLGVEAWAVYMLSLLAAVVLIAVGLVLGVAQLLDRRDPQDPPVTFSSGTR